MTFGLSFISNYSYRCPGEALGRAEVMLITLTLIRTFELSRVRDDLDFTPVPGITFRPKDFEILARKRP